MNESSKSRTDDKPRLAHNRDFDGGKHEIKMRFSFSPTWLIAGVEAVVEVDQRVVRLHDVVQRVQNKQQQAVVVDFVFGRQSASKEYHDLPSLPVHAGSRDDFMASDVVELVVPPRARGAARHSCSHLPLRLRLSFLTTTAALRDLTVTQLSQLTILCSRGTDASFPGRRMGCQTSYCCSKRLPQMSPSVLSRNNETFERMRDELLCLKQTKWVRAGRDVRRPDTAD